MINLLLLLVFLSCLGITAAWLAENPGQVTIHWFDYRVDTSFSFLLLAALVTVFAASFAVMLIRKLILAPSQMKQRRSLNQYQRGLAELTHSVAALAASDISGAAAHTRKAEKMLGSTPLTLLLSAQIARIQGDDAKTRVLLEEMLGHSETEYLAARFLSDAATKQQQFPKALALAQRAQAANPKGVHSVVSLHTRLGQWQEALGTIGRAGRKGHLTRAERRRQLGLVYLQQAQQLMAEGNKETALAAAKRSLKDLPAFPPAIAFTARALGANGKKAKAIRLLLHSWKQVQHPLLAESLRNLTIGDTPEKQMKLARKLAARCPASPESELAVAQTALTLHQWDVARKALKAAVSRDESVRACRMMAELEQGEFNDFDASTHWLNRSAAAHADATWVCRECGAGAALWDAHCTSCGAFDSLEWKKRELAFAA